MRLFGTLNVLVLWSMSLISAIEVHQTSTLMYKRLQNTHVKDRTNRLTRRETVNKDSENILSGNKLNEFSGAVSTTSQRQAVDDRSTVWPRPIRLRGMTETGHSRPPGRVSPEVDLVTTYHDIELPLAAINRLHLHHQSQNGHSDGNVMAEHSGALGRGNIPKPLDRTRSKPFRSRHSVNNRRDVRSTHRLSLNLGKNKIYLSKHHTLSLTFNTNTPGGEDMRDNFRKRSSAIQKGTGRSKTFIDFMGISTTSSLGENGFNKDWHQSSNLAKSTYDHQHIHTDSWPERLLASKGLSSDQFAVSGRADLSSFPDRRSLKGDSNYFHNVHRSGPHSASISVQAALIGDDKLSREYFTSTGKLYDDKIHTDKMSSLKQLRKLNVNMTLKEELLDKKRKSETAENTDSFITHKFDFYEKNEIVDAGKGKDFTIQLQSIHMENKKRSLNGEINENQFNQLNNATCISMTKNEANDSGLVQRKKRRTLFKVSNLSSSEQRIKLKSRRKLPNEQIVKLNRVPSKKVIKGENSVPWEARRTLTRHVQKIETENYSDEEQEVKLAKISSKLSEGKRTGMSISPGIDLVKEETLLREGPLHSNTLGMFNHPDKSPEVSAPDKQNARLSKEKRATIGALSYAFVYGPQIASLTHTSKADVTDKNVGPMSKYMEDIGSYVNNKTRRFPLKYIGRNISKRNYTDRLALLVRKRKLHLAFIDRVNKEKADMSISDQITFKPDGHLGISSDGKSEVYMVEGNERSDDNRLRQLGDKRSQGSDSLIGDRSVNNEMGKWPGGQYVNSTSLLMDTNNQNHGIPKHLNDEKLYLENEEKGKTKVVSIIAEPKISSDDNRERNVHSNEEVIMCRSMKDSSLCPTLSPLIDPYVQSLDTGLLEGFSSYTELFHIEDEPIRNRVTTDSERIVKTLTESGIRKNNKENNKALIFDSHVAPENFDEIQHSHLRRRRSESLTSEMPEYDVKPTSASAVDTTISAISTQENYFSTTSTGTFHYKKISLVRLNKPSLDLTHIMYLLSSETSDARDFQLVPWENKDFDEQGRPIIKIGVILVAKSSALFSLNKSRSAIELAGEKIISPSGSLPGYTIQMVFRDSACSEVFGPLAGIDLYMLNLANVYIGPSCDYALAPLARFTPYWAKGIPVLTAGGLVGAFADKNTFQLLTRMQGSHTKTAEFFMSIIESLQWKHLCLAYHDYKFALNHAISECTLMLTPIYDILLSRKIFVWHTAFNEHEDPLNLNMIFEGLQKNCRSE